MAVYVAQDDTFDCLTAGGVGIIDFYSTHCGPCRVLLPKLMQIEAQMPFIQLVKVNTDHCPQLTERYHIAGVPAVYLFKDGVFQEYHGIMDAEPIQKELAKLLYE